MLIDNSFGLYTLGNSESSVNAKQTLLASFEYCVVTVTCPCSLLKALSVDVAGEHI